jgi:uncharacterized protein YdhG (YjbR/CyaY superfamily)
VCQPGAIVHVAAWKRHLSLYPVPHAGGDLDGELGPYRGGAGTLRFTLDQPLPLPLIRRVVERLLAERAPAPRETRPASSAGRPQRSATMPHKEEP